MSVLTEIAQKVKELLDNLETLEQEKIVTFEYPFEDKEEYFCLNINGEIVQNLWSGGPFDEGVYTQGHVFKNREEARKERDKRYLLMRFNQFRDKCNGDWKPESEKAKYYIFLQYANRMLCVYSSMFFDAFNMFGYFKNFDDAERAVELFGDEIKRLFVEEEK
nr:MAG TPA: hypothetical protein [Bacteriophage sp.]